MDASHAYQMVDVVPRALGVATVRLERSGVRIWLWGAGLEAKGLRLPLVGGWSLAWFLLFRLPVAIVVVAVAGGTHLGTGAIGDQPGALGTEAVARGDGARASVRYSKEKEMMMISSSCC